MYAHEKGCPWDKDTCLQAAENGHLKCLQYAHEKGCPWDRDTSRKAAQNGHLKCLQYAHEKGCPWDEGTSISAANYRHFKCLEYAHKNGCPYPQALMSTIVKEVLIPKWRNFVKRRRIVNYWMSYKDHIRYAPGGPGFYEAKTSFEQAQVQSKNRM